MRNRKNRLTQLAVLIILILLLMLLSIWIGIYAAAGSEEENMTQASEKAETDSGENMDMGAEQKPEEDAKHGTMQALETESTAETEKDMTQVSEVKDPKEYFTQCAITDEIYERINGCSYVENEVIALEDLRYLQVLHIGFDGEEHVGELIVNKAVAEDILDIFYTLYENHYPIERMELVDEYGGDDEKSMQANNTSAFNYRTVEGSDKLSNHSYGTAIDINPFYNPCVRTYADGSTKSFPEGSDIYADRSADFPHKIDKDDLCYQLFTEHGFRWGGNWNSLKDYQHFDKKYNEQ